MSRMKSFFVVALVVIIVLVGATILRAYMYPIKYEDEFKTYCSQFEIPLSLGYAVAKCESNFNYEAISFAGAIGIMQLMPTTADYIAGLIGYYEEINLQDYKVNIMLGCAYLSYLMNKFDNMKQVVMAYNAGEGRVQEWMLSDPNLIELPYDETKNYYAKVKYAKFVYDNLI